MNDTLFKPHGLYALIVSYDTRSSSPSSSFDLSSAIAKETSGSLSNTLKKSSHKSSSLPLDAAPLIFPALDALPDEQKRNAFKRGGNFVAEYYDRRSQAIFRQQNPGNDKLTVGHDPQFASRYSDPNSAANSGSLMALVTGGAFDPREVRLGRRNRKRQMLGLPPQQGNLRDKLKAKRGDSMLDKVRRTLKQVSWIEALTITLMRESDRVVPRTYFT